MSEEVRDKSKTAEREEETLKFWKEKDIFKKSLEKDAPEGDFVFYEGPPTANGKPGIHHLEARAFKDIIPRYKTMRGFRVARKGGWDTHGLPVELQVEKQLGLKSKKEIESYGVAEFNKKCKESVWQYVDLWEKFTDRIGYWVDQKNPYVTYHNEYIEAVWNVVKNVNEKDLIYKDYKVVPWCPRCGTALSSHELAQGYEDVKDLSVTAKFKIIGFPDAYFLAWTTTPWTLLGNVGLAVGKDIVYVEAKVNGEILVLAKEKLQLIQDPYEVIAEHKGSEMVGMAYEPLYNFIPTTTPNFEKAHKVYVADFVNTTDGTGIVHTAVMYGQEDFELGTKVGLPKYHTVDDTGHFVKGTGFLEGKFVKDEETAVEVIKDLAHRGLLFKKEKYEHSYPHCWRCKTPLIYYARDSWYIRMSELRDKLVKENEKINWEPKHIKEGRFGEWLKEIKDWAISRERYWGTPLPIWQNEKGEKIVIGSIDELKKRTKKSGNKYFVMRHGESEKNIKNVMNSDLANEYSLTEAGKEQARASAEILKKENIDLIISSPFPRCKETAEIAKEVVGFQNEVIIDDRLWELKTGQNFEGKYYEEYRKSFVNSEDRFYHAPEGGETLFDVNKRVGDFLYELERKYENKKILIVTHQAPIIGMFNVVKGFTLEQIIKDKEYKNNMPVFAGVSELDFTPLPHNENYELDLHKPYIDEVELVDEKGEKLTRTKEVMDVWFDSGSMPFASIVAGYPADFISEAIDQTRGWFYTLHAIGILMGKGHAYNNVICLGHILDDKGKKMSKSLGNIVDPWLVTDKFGVDALRLWMYSVNQPGDSKNFDEKTVDEIVKKVFNPLENILSFYEMYLDKNFPMSDMGESKNVLDKWIISRLSELVSDGSKNLDNYKIFEASRAIRDFVNDFSTWYVRRSRERFKSDDAADKMAALSTTRFVLLELAKYMAPFTPFFSEHLYQTLKSENDPESVHLVAWPHLKKADEDVLKKMEEVRRLVSLGLEKRNTANIKVRQPLQKLTIATEEKLEEEYLNLIKDEVNVKEVAVGDTLELDTNITPELKKEGDVREFIRAVQDLRKEKNLTPDQKITLLVETSEEGRTFIESAQAEISKPTNVSNFDFVSNGGKKIKIENLEFTLDVS